MKRILYDIETDGFLDVFKNVWCATILDLDTQELVELTPENIDDLPRLLYEADEVWGHNIIAFDFPVVYKHWPEWEARLREKFDGHEGTRVMDTLVMSRLIWPDIRNMDFENLARKRLILPADDPKAKKALIGSHSLKAWGYRMNYFKSTPGEAGFEKYTPEMMEYCTRDVLVNAKFLDMILAKEPSEVCVFIEHQFAKYLFLQMSYGVAFDVDYAEWLVAQWRAELERRIVEMKAKVPDIIQERTFTPKANNSRYGYKKGVPVTKTKVIEFNPRSNDHIIGFLMNKYNWKPKEFTRTKSQKWPKGKPKVTYDILKALKYDEAPLLARINLLMTRIGLVADEKKAWLACQREGRIYGQIIHNGTNTHRCRHFNPNLGNIPSGKAVWGHTIRELFIPTGRVSKLTLLRDKWLRLRAKTARRSQDGTTQKDWETNCPFPDLRQDPHAKTPYMLAGTDFDSLEMRAMSEALWDYDDGAFFKMAFTGTKQEGTDAHSLNRDAIIDALKAFGFDKVAAAYSRDKAKTNFYAKIYGAWVRKLGMVAAEGLGVNPRMYKEIGEAVEAGLNKNLRGLEELNAELEAEFDHCIHTLRQWPHLSQIDGRKVPVRKKGALFNTLLQSMGAVLCKKACVDILAQATKEIAPPGEVWRMVLHVHDEIQNEVKNEGKILTDFSRVVDECFRGSGEFFGLRTPITGTTDTGTSWAQTH